MTREVLAQGSTISISKNYAWGEIYYTITNGRSTLLLSSSEWELFKAVVRQADLEETEGSRRKSKLLEYVEWWDKWRVKE